MENLKVEGFEGINRVLESIRGEFKLINIETEDFYKGINLVEDSLNNTLKNMDKEYLLPVEVSINDKLDEGLELVENKINNINREILIGVEGGLNNISDTLIKPILTQLEGVGNKLVDPLEIGFDNSINNLSNKLDENINKFSSSIFKSSEDKLNDIGKNLFGDFGKDIGDKIIGPIEDGFNSVKESFITKMEDELKGLGGKVLDPIRDRLNTIGDKVVSKIGDRFGSLKDNLLKESQVILGTIKSKVMGPLENNVKSFGSKIMGPLRNQMSILGTKVVGKLSSYMTSLVPVLSSFSKATMSLMSNPIFLIATGITLLTLAIYDLWKGFKGGNSFLMPLIDKFLAFMGVNKNFIEVIEGLKDKFNSLFEGFKPLINNLFKYILSFKDLIIGIFTFDKELINKGFEGIIASLENIKNIVFNLFNDFSAYIRLKMGESAGAVLDIVGGVFESISLYLKSIKDIFIGIFTLDKELILEGLLGVFDSFREIIENIKELIINIKNIFLEVFSSLLEPILKPFKSAFSFLEEKLSYFTDKFLSISNFAEKFSISKGIESVKGFFGVGNEEKVQEEARVNIPNSRKETNVNISGIEMPINLPEGFSGDESEFREKAGKVMEELWRNMMSRSYAQMVGD